MWVDGESIDGEFHWDKWAAPKKDGEFDHNIARIGDDLIKFVDQELFPYLAAFRGGGARWRSKIKRFLESSSTGH